ncbi:MAG: hypothetical protein U0Q11_24110 [Vicinamibacterales bacterium]
MLRLMGAHALVTCSAGAFGFLCVLSARESARALLGPQRFQRVSPGLHAFVFVCLITLLLLLPAFSAPLAQGRLSSDGVLARSLPATWFVGVHEAMVGDIIIDSPRSRVPAYLQRADTVATEGYQRVRLQGGRLAFMALAALITVSGIALTASLWNSRRWPIGTSQTATPSRQAPRTWSQVVNACMRSPMRRAGLLFGIQSITRSHRLRITLAVPVSVALAIVSVLECRPLLGSSGGSPNPVTILATQWVVLAVLLGGFLQVTRIPTDMSCQPTVVLGTTGSLREYVSGIKSAAWLLVIVPALATQAPLVSRVIGHRETWLHLGAGVVVGKLMLDAVFYRTLRMPFVDPHPSMSLPHVRLAFGGCALIAASFACGAVEHAAFRSPFLHAGVLGVVMVMSAALQRQGEGG